MSFKDTYCRESDKAKPENKDKKVVSDDTYAQIDLLNELVEELKRNRLK